MLTGDDLAYATLDYIRENPEEWDQDCYQCGTVACFAGRAIMLATGEQAVSREIRAEGVDIVAKQAARVDERPGGCCVRLFH